MGSNQFVCMMRADVWTDCSCMPLQHYASHHHELLNMVGSRTIEVHERQENEYEKVFHV